MNTTNAPTHTKTPEQLKAEYDRWYARGLANEPEGCYRVLANMLPGSNAYEALADGLAARMALPDSKRK